MRHIADSVIALVVLTSCVFAATYKNPVWNYDFADPFVLPQGSSYYAYSTNSGTMNIPTILSTDGSFTNWQLLGDALPTLPPWAEANAGLTWAPTILEVAGGNPAYVMYYTARWTTTGYQCVSYATSNSPAGPFVDPNLSVPWLCQTSIGGSIDPSPFVDDNGLVYLVWKNDGNCCNFKVNIWSQPLTSNGTMFEPGTSPTALITNDQAWEATIVEGPSMIKYGNGPQPYYLFYSANWYQSYQYAVGYATCSTPTGPCVKPTYSPIIGYYGDVWGPGGEQPFTDASGKWWFCYHAWAAPNATYPDGIRSLRIDRLNFLEGVPFIADHVPTTRDVHYDY